ncbi:MAG TPA: polysaccharide ABC transporter ATP-binding protein [Bacteroidia bacterium]|jgi:lipopolysaccharide transport system ATP-binding protein|nr:polysaccharide ABC transporter ATP-binding protein [Bacteroidia bacterium]
MEPVIKIENVGKKYFLSHHAKDKYLTLRDMISDGVKAIMGKRKGKPNNFSEEFWALQNVSFELNQGDRIGIIGRNGAGKSTLLKILSRITEPTSGRITINGNIASLLEVGTGFHPELSGRENIFLNGAILGMSKAEIESKFDEIVAFAEIERFLDTPVKRYSSGMYVRLAFSIAAHLEPDILIIDEVLAVGDAAFQKKCLGKMEEVSGKGRTVIFVSHNMQVVQKLCNYGVLLEKGKVVLHGNIGSVIEKYLESSKDTQSIYEIAVSSEHLNSPGYAKRIQIEDINGNLLTEVPVGKRWQIRVIFTLTRTIEHFIIAIGLKNAMEVPIRTFYSNAKTMEADEYEAIFKSDDIILAAGRYNIVLGLSSHESSFYYQEDIAAISISEFSEIEDERIVRVSSVGLILNPINVIINKFGT